jgi:hypothetical protein
MSRALSTRVKLLERKCGLDDPNAAVIAALGIDCMNAVERAELRQRIEHELERRGEPLTADKAGARR